MRSPDRAAPVPRTDPPLAVAYTPSPDDQAPAWEPCDDFLDALAELLADASLRGESATQPD